MSKAKSKRKRNQIVSDNEDTDDDQPVALTDIQPPLIRIADGPFWALWILIDRVSRERFKSTSNNDDVEKFFEKVKECKNGCNTPNEETYKLVQIAKIDKKDMPHILRLKVNILPMQKPAKKNEKEDFWDLLVYNDLGFTLSKIAQVKSILIVDGPTLASKKLIILNNKSHNRFSRVFFNYEGPMTNANHFFKKNRISTAEAFECTVFSNSEEGRETNSLIRLMPYDEKDVKIKKSPKKTSLSNGKCKKSPAVVKRKNAVKSKSPRIDIDANNELLAGGFIRYDNEELEKSISNIFEESDQNENSQNVDDLIDDEEEENNEEINITIANPTSTTTTPKSRYSSSRTNTKRSITPTKKNNNYNYEKLMELRKQLDKIEKSTRNRGRGSIIKLPDQRFVYGIVQTLENKPTDSPSTYRIRIKDETMDGVLVRIHSSDSEGTGIQPSIDDIIRIHRITAQIEIGDHSNMVLSTCHHRNYVLFDSRLENVNGPIIKHTLAKTITFDKSDKDRVLELRRVLKDDHDIAANSISSSSFERKDPIGETQSSPRKTRATTRQKQKIPPLVITIDDEDEDDEEASNNDNYSMHTTASILSSSEEEEDTNKQKRNNNKTTPSPTSNARITRSKSITPKKESRRRKADPEEGTSSSKRRK